MEGGNEGSGLDESGEIIGFGGGYAGAPRRAKKLEKEEGPGWG